MLTRILHNSPKLCAFLNQLDLELYKPQRQHILNIADALLTCEDEKTLAELQRQFLEAPDASNMADCLRISPWSTEAIRSALRANQLKWALTQAERLGASKTIYINLDDLLGEKDKHTSHLEAVDWLHDHSESTPKQPRFKEETSSFDIGNLFQKHRKDMRIKVLSRYRNTTPPLHYSLFCDRKKDLNESHEQVGYCARRIRHNRSSKTEYSACNEAGFYQIASAQNGDCDQELKSNENSGEKFRSRNNHLTNELSGWDQHGFICKAPIELIPMM